MQKKDACNQLMQYCTVANANIKQQISGEAVIWIPVATMTVYHDLSVFPHIEGAKTSRCCTCDLTMKF